ncbi:MAG: DUF2256 domain-containing protein [Proteobacteria bacterium]|nr:DUF2256 domain-containing protein [Pseudomonadota bacterium]
MQPEKLCRTCNKPFAWRKKWARDWEHVLYCSERCRRQKNQANSDPSAAASHA